MSLKTLSPLVPLILACPVLSAEPSKDPAVSDAVARALPIVQQAAANYPKNRTCFSCHHQTLPMLAMATAKKTNIPIDATLLQAQADFTHQSFHGRLGEMKEGRGIGGRSMTVSYGLWALHLADFKPNETTEGMVSYLLKDQQADGRWTKQTSRPPLEDSDVMSTVLAGYGMLKYASASQRDQVNAAVAKAKEWLKQAEVKSQEDRAALLWGHHLLGADEKALQEAKATVLAAQREDGGWSQLESMSSDAYATGQTLFILRAVGLPAADPAYQRGVQFLLSTQEKDGSWFVQTRSRPIQTYFDNGDPHGKHQFISTPATSWAIAALAQ